MCRNLDNIYCLFALYYNNSKFDIQTILIIKIKSHDKQHSKEREKT